MKLPKPVEHPNADRLEGFIINGNRVWYTKGLLQEEDVVIYFPIESQINPKILSNLNLFNDKSLNANKEISGYFDSRGRVRAVKLRGQPSEGFILTANELLTSLDVKQPIFLEVDTEFDSIENFDWVCKKYVPNPSRNSGTGPKGPKTKMADILLENEFQFNKDTKKLSDNLHKLEPNDIISISYKLHGTSAVFANVLTKRKLSLLEKIAKFFGASVQTTEYSKMYSSRSVIKYIENKYHTAKEGYYNTDIWGKAFEKVRNALEKGITIYAEIVGYDGENRLIQKDYDYGQKPGTFEIYVYRITYKAQDGNIYEMDWDAVKQYCYRHNLRYVPELFYGTVSEYIFKEALKLKDVSDQFGENLLEILKANYLEKPCHMCKNKVPAEGIVVRRETNGFESWKLKSFAFLERESKQLDNDEIDIETNESTNES